MCRGPCDSYGLSLASELPRESTDPHHSRAMSEVGLAEIGVESLVLSSGTERAARLSYVSIVRGDQFAWPHVES